MSAQAERIKQDIVAGLAKLQYLVQEYSCQVTLEAHLPASIEVIGAIDKLASALSTTPERICWRTNRQDVVLPRQICQYVLRHALSLSYPEIAQATGIDHHTTVISSCRKIEKMRFANSEFDAKIRDLCAIVLDEETAEKELA